MQKLRVRPGQNWSYEDYWKTLPVGRHKTIGRILFVLQEVIEYLDLGQPDIAFATVVQLFKALHQFLVDGGSWKAAWLLTLMEDPYGEEEFGGTSEELAVVGGHLKASAELWEKVHGKPPPTLAAGETDDPEAGKTYSKGRGRGRGR